VVFRFCSFVFFVLAFFRTKAHFGTPPLLQRREPMPDTLFTFFDALAFTWPPSYGTIFQIGAVVYFMGWLLIQWDNARPMRGSAEHETASAHGTARWARWRDVTKAKLNAKYDGIILGLWKHKGKVLRVNTDSHIVTLAPTRSGKGVSAIIPNMLHYKGSCFIIDPKGENARLSARRRRAMGQAVFVLDP
jgi:type IV secretory pathway TraG/TraD family ATPase VirD4